jgi:threonylcarbamoyladenosine tRNA methylthiotransferase MtaB
VTHVAARKSRQAIRHLARANPNLRVAVIGCYAETAPEEAAALDGVVLVVGNADKESVLARILAQEPAPGAPPGEAPPLPGTLPAGLHTRALVKIQDGCDNHCTYCLVRVARGPSRSRPAAAVLAEVRRRVAEGYREVVLTGVKFSAPMAAIPARAPSRWIWRAWCVAALESGVARLRLSSIEPWDVTPALIDLWADPRLCRHLHLPLQSGCDATPAPYGAALRRGSLPGLADELRARIPGVALAADVIVGFPGETDDEFAATLDTVRRAGLSGCTSFAIRRAPAPRPTLPGAVDPRVAQARSEALIALGQEQALAFHQGMVGDEVEVLLESTFRERGITLWSGLTDNYVRVACALPEGRRNSLVRVRAVSADTEGLRGQAIA